MGYSASNRAEFDRYLFVILSARVASSGCDARHEVHSGSLGGGTGMSSAVRHSARHRRKTSAPLSLVISADEARCDAVQAPNDLPPGDAL
jgi:hypothetical protein